MRQVNVSMIDNFELVVAKLLPACHVATNVNNKRKNSQIYGVGGDIKHSTGPEKGVELRYYRPNKFFKLTAEEVAGFNRLRPNRKKLGGIGGKGG